jgi:hypothetical protein
LGVEYTKNTGRILVEERGRFLLKMVKQGLWFLPFVAREMQGRCKGEAS